MQLPLFFKCENMNETIQNIMNRKSVRNFTGESILRDNLEEVVRAGMAAPSARNMQPWEFVIVTERTALDELCEGLPYAKMLDKAGAAIVVCGTPAKNEFAEKYWVQDCCAATENILLAVEALGLGAVWTAAYPEVERYELVQKVLDIPTEIIPLNVIPVGVPAIDAKPLEKFNSEKIHWGKY